LRLRRAPSGYVIWGVFFAMTIFGYYRVSKYNNASSNYLRETREAKMAIFPYRKVTFFSTLHELLPFSHSSSQAEADALLLGRMNAEAAYEAKVMKDIDGWVPGQSVYTYRWVPPNENLRREIDDIQL
jgi:hypothetical protein